MLDGAKAFFFMIGDEADSPVLRYLDQTDARVVAAPGPIPSTNTVSPRSIARRIESMRRFAKLPYGE